MNYPYFNEQGPFIRPPCYPAAWGFDKKTYSGFQSRALKIVLSIVKAAFYFVSALQLAHAIVIEYRFPFGVLPANEIISHDVTFELRRASFAPYFTLHRAFARGNQAR